jgi:hypothetical protein
MGSSVRREEFLWSRAFLRSRLAAVLGVPPGSLVFGKGPKGKPYLEGRDLHFNLSHTEGWVVCSLALDPVGVDLEGSPDLRGMERLVRVADRFFSDLERGYLGSLPLEDRPMASVRIFTLKEAHAKALGMGLALSGRDFSVPLPLKRWGWDGEREYASLPGPVEGLWLAHVAPRTQGPRRYRWTQWEGCSFLDGSPASTTEILAGMEDARCPS